MDLWSPAAAGVVAVGAVSGVLSGMLGIGGAALTTPGIRALGATPIQAVGSTIPAILPGAVAGAVRYARAGLVDWRVGLVCGLSGSVLAVAGAKVAGAVDARLLMVLTAVLVAWNGVSLLREASPPAGAPRGEPGRGPVGPAPAGGPPTDEPGSAAPAGSAGTTVLVAVGAAAGFVAGLLGVGGGVVLVPAFRRVLRLPIKVAVASSLVGVAVFSLPALVTHALDGHVEPTYAALLVVGVVPGARVGARLTIAASERRVRRLGGAFFLVLAAVYGSSEIRGIAGD